MTAAEKPDLGAVYDQHMRHEFVDCDLEATMATMVAQPHTYFAPTGAGGVGHHGVASFYTRHFIGSDKWPVDWKIHVVSRTVGENRLVEEFIVSFTHDVEMDYILPGLPPTGKRVEVPHVVVVTFEHDKIVSEHIYWDQASVLVQVGLLDPDQLRWSAPSKRANYVSWAHTEGIGKLRLGCGCGQRVGSPFLTVCGTGLGAQFQLGLLQLAGALGGLELIIPRGAGVAGPAATAGAGRRLSGVGYRARSPRAWCGRSRRTPASSWQAGRYEYR